MKKFLIIVSFIISTQLWSQSFNTLNENQNYKFSEVLSTGLAAVYFDQITSVQCLNTQNLAHELEILKKQSFLRNTYSYNEIVMFAQNKHYPIIAKISFHFLSMLKENTSNNKNINSLRSKKIQYMAKRVSPNWNYHTYNLVQKLSNDQSNPKNHITFGQCLVVSETLLILKAYNLIEMKAKTIVWNLLKTNGLTPRLRKYRYNKLCTSFSNELKFNNENQFNEGLNYCIDNNNRTAQEVTDSICSKREFRYQCLMHHYLKNKRTPASYNEN